MVIGWLNTFGWNDQEENIGAQGYVVEFDTSSVPATESMETVGIRLEEPNTRGAMLTYHIDPLYREAGAVIFEHQPPTSPALEVVIPGAATTYHTQPISFLVAGYHPTAAFQEVEFFVDGQKVGSSLPLYDRPENGGLNFFSLVWESATSGHHVLQAKSTLPEGVISSSEIPFVVDGVNHGPTALITEPRDGSTFLKGEPIAISVSASDSDGKVTRVELLVDENVVASADGASLHFTLENAAVGSHSLLARATDDRGGIGTSAVTHILVRHPDAVAFVQRELPESYSPSVPFAVELRANPPKARMLTRLKIARPARGRWPKSVTTVFSIPQQAR